MELQEMRHEMFILPIMEIQKHILKYHINIY